MSHDQKQTHMLLLWSYFALYSLWWSRVKQAVKMEPNQLGLRLIGLFLSPSHRECEQTVTVFVFTMTEPQ